MMNTEEKERERARGQEATGPHIKSSNTVGRTGPPGLTCFPGASGCLDASMRSHRSVPQVYMSHSVATDPARERLPTSR